MRAELAFGIGDLPRTDVVQHARAFAHPAWARELPALPYVEAEGNLPRVDSLLAIDNPNVILSACKPADDGAGVILRLYNATDDPQAATVEFGIPADRWCRADLREQWNEAGAHPVDAGTIPLTLGPHEICTILLRHA